MEQSFTIDGLSPGFIFNDLRGAIIDYVISSYQVNLKLIYLYYWRPELQIHCHQAFNGTGKEGFVHIHNVKPPGIYHAKFILITTTEVLKLIVMSTNITEPIVKDCLNDYYVITIPKRGLGAPTPFTNYLYQFFDAFNIHLRSGILQYQWEGVQAKLLISVPGKISHGICYNAQIKKPPKTVESRAVIRCASMMAGYDIKKVIHVKKCILEYIKPECVVQKYGLYDLENNKEKDGKTERYILKSIEPPKPFHYKRYTIEYRTREKTDRYLIVTSANLTRQAWGTSKYAALNAELGVIWNSKFSFN